jgi:hypothetical protein
MPRQPTQKETIEYHAQFLEQWNAFCDAHGLKKRLASHACRFAFMQMTAEQREETMGEAKNYVVASRRKQRKK